MDYDFFGAFTPRIIDVVKRDATFFESFDFVLQKEKTGLYIMAWVYAGSGNMQLDDTHTALKSGDLFHIHPGRKMVITTSPTDTLVFYSIHYQSGLLRWEGQEAIWKQTEAPLPLEQYQHFGEQSVLKDTFIRLFEIWQEKHSGYVWQVKVGLLEILHELTRYKLMENEEDRQARQIIQTSIDYIKLHVHDESLNRERMAQHAALSPGYFSILFKKHTGISPIHYLNKIRMDRAKELLRTSRISIKQIATLVGFSDSFYFSRVFGKETGMSPRDYRNA
jgi:AraC-like DNA-binding protein